MKCYFLRPSAVNEHSNFVREKVFFWFTTPQQQQQQQHYICTWIYNSFYNNIFKIPKIKWRPPVVTMRASWEQVACIEEELQRLLVRIGKNSISGYIVLQAEL